MTVEVVVIGSAMIDLTSYTENMPKLGETVKGNGFEKSFGGKGANQAVQCARLGVSTAFVGAVGNDVYGSDYKNSLTNETINVQHLQTIDNCNSGIATIWVEATGKNSIIIIPGANLKFDDSQLENTLSSVKSAKVAMFQNEIAEKVTEQGLRLVKELGILSIFNPAPVSEYCNQIVGLCDILCVNEVELSVLANLPVSNENEIYTACRKLLQGGCQSVIATLGEQGAVLVTQDEQVVFAAPKVKAVDSVGAGDSFLGCLAAQLARGSDIHVAIRQAIECASISVQSKGAQPSYASLSQLPPFIHPPPRN